MESVPEKVEPIVSVATPTELPVANHVVDTGFVEEHTDETPNTPAEDADGEIEQKPVEEKPPIAGEDIASPQPEPDAEPEAPAKEMQQLEIAVEDEKEVDTAEVPANPQDSTESPEVAEVPPEEKMAVMEDLNAPAAEEEEEEDRYKNLKVMLTLPEQDKGVPKEENGEKLAEKESINADDEKTVPDKAKDDKERDSDSGRGSAADTSSVDLNLSISSFLSKTKEPGSVSIQVTHTVHIFKYQKLPHRPA